MSKRLETKRKILEALKENSLTVPELSRKLSLSRATIRQHIAELNETGALEEIPDEYFKKHISYKAKQQVGKAILNDARARFNAGVVLYEKGKFADALKEFDAAISIDPKFASAYHNKALAESSVGHFDSAIKNLNKVFELQPKSHDAAMAMASIETGRKNYAKARFWYGKALELYPDYYMAKIGLSTLDIIEEVDEKFKEHKKNVEKYRRQEEEIAEELKKNDEKYRRQREEVYEELKKNDEKYRRQLERNPYAAFHEAVVEIKRGDLDSAINHLNRVIKSKLLLKRKAFVLMGIIEEKRRHRTKAKEWYGKARELDNGYIKYKKWYKKILKERW